MNMSRLLAAAISAAAAPPALSMAGPAPVPTYTSEKCYVPIGTCKKIAGGTTKSQLGGRPGDGNEVEQR